MKTHNMPARRTWFGCLTALSLLSGARLADAATIDTAHRSGVEGYPIGIFGTGFGADQGSGNVAVLGTEATITLWSDTVIEAVVPEVAVGTGNLVVTASDATTAESPFEVYEIDPKFLVAPADLENLAEKKTFVLDGTHDDWAGDPTVFLGYNDGTHGANFFAPISIAFDMETALSEDVWFSFFADSDWYTGGPIATAYTIDASADSTDGIDGTWETFETIPENDRKSRIHKVTLTGQRWIRMHITAVQADPGHAGINEVRVYKRTSAGTAPPDIIGLFGDSITYGDHRYSGDNAVDGLIAAARNDGSVPHTYPMGLIGAGSDVLHTPPYAVSDVVAITPDIYYVGITLGTNIKADNAASFTQAVEDLIAADKVPILARMADTDSDNGGYGTPEYKKQTVQEVDEIAAQFRLIPGPDFYTPFRQNLGTYLSDGTHHSDAGAAVVRQLWADTFQRVRAAAVAAPEGGSGGASASGGSGAAPSGGQGGSTASGGATNGGTGGSEASGGSTTTGPGANSTNDASEGGCGCRVVGSPKSSVPLLLGAFLALAFSTRRSRRSDFRDFPGSTR